MLKALTGSLATHGFCNSLHWTGTSLYLVTETALPLGQEISVWSNRNAESHTSHLLIWPTHISSLIMEVTMYKELHSKSGISCVPHTDGDCDATQCAQTQCPHQPCKESFCLKETWDTKPHFLSYLQFISVVTNFLHVVPGVGSIVPDSFTVTLSSLKLHFLEKFNSCIGLLTYALSKSLLLCVSLFPYVQILSIINLEEKQEKNKKA